MNPLDGGDSGILVPLRERHQLIVERGAGHDVIALAASDGTLRVCIRFDGQTSQIAIEGGSISVKASRELSLEGERVRVFGRKGLELGSGGDATLMADGNVRVTGTRIDLN
jgi:hypothetical protein